MDTLHRSLNFMGLGGNFHWWNVTRTMIAAGWTVVESGSGIGGFHLANTDVFDAAPNNPFRGGDPVGLAKLSSSNPLGPFTEPWCSANYCWIVLQSPLGAGFDQYLFQRNFWFGGDLADAYWTIAWAPEGDFDFTLCNASTAPAATLGGPLYVLQGTINGNGAVVSSPGTVAIVSSVAADDTSSGQGTGAHGVFGVEVTAPNMINNAFMIDDFRQLRAVEMDAKPVVTAVGPYAALVGYIDANTLGQNYPVAIVDRGGPTEAWRGVAYNTLKNAANVYLVPGSGGSSVAGQSDVPIVIGHPTHGGVLGVSRWLDWQAISRSYPDTNTAKTDWFVQSCRVKSLGDGVTDPTPMP